MEGAGPRRRLPAEHGDSEDDLDVMRREDGSYEILMSPAVAPATLPLKVPMSRVRPPSRQAPMSPADPRSFGLRSARDASVASSPASKAPVLTELNDSIVFTAHPTTPDSEAGKTRSKRVAKMTDLNMPSVSIPETQRYTFALILRNTTQVKQLLRERFPRRADKPMRRRLAAEVGAMQVKCLRRLVQAGLGVILLDNDNTIPHDTQRWNETNNICVLIDPYKDKELLLQEFKREKDELAIRRGYATARLGVEPLESLRNVCFSPALELQLTHNLIRNAFRDYDKEDWVLDMSKELTCWDVVEHCFPLHDRAFNAAFFTEYRKQTFDVHLRKATTGNSERWAIEELRLHFGERVAFLFAFMHVYSKLLLPLTALCVLYYVGFRWVGGFTWNAYLVGLAALGFGVASMWAPALLLVWERETRTLTEKWRLASERDTVFERDDENPAFAYVWVKNAATHEMEKVPKERRKRLIRVAMVLFVVLSSLVQCVVLMPFLQWYVWSKLAPTCDGPACAARGNCRHFLNCFHSPTSTVGTDRWAYILIQGVLLGLLIDTVFFELFNWFSAKFVEWENVRGKADFENRLVHRRFVFVWANWFFWFLTLAFFYLPYGNRVNDLFRRLGWGWAVVYEWDPSVLTLDTLFVTPLVVTQLLNMLLETWLPYLIRRVRGRPASCRSVWSTSWLAGLRCVQALKTKKAKHRREHHMTAQTLADHVSASTRFFVPVLGYSDDSNEYTAYEILAESTLPVFDTTYDYLDAAIQFSYVIMFTAVWPLLPLPAFLNNVLEVRGDAFRLLFGHRRPMPRRDASIGEWATVLHYANVMAITVVSGLIAMYHLGALVAIGGDDACDVRFDAAAMVPFWTMDVGPTRAPADCTAFLNDARWSMRQVVAFIVLEHIGFVARYLVLQMDKTPAAIASSAYQRLKQIRELTAARSAPAAVFEYIGELRTIFDKYDADGSDHLYQDDLVLFLAEWVGKDAADLQPHAAQLLRYMDKNRLGKVPFSTCCLMLQHAHHDRFFSVLLGIYDSLDDFRNERIRAAGPVDYRRVLREPSTASDASRDERSA
ncbi:transmembrane protein [Achlya hypogyna]|uniref:Transmembrane protein n=1 Tax=Achlya hypogyna TaxID=1202772 RepID=A0A1V9YNK3_ACHHY|nr:transmembrane protein [Achlya hypogyna]